MEKKRYTKEVCVVCGNDTEDCSTWYREDEGEICCEDCYMDWLSKNK